MILESAVLGLLVGLIAKGSLRYVLRKRFRGLWLVFVSVACEFFVSSGGMTRLLVKPSWAQDLVWLADGTTALVFFAVLQYSTLVVFLLLNFPKPGLRIVLVGSLCNAAVILANGGRMPIGSALYSAFGQNAVDRVASAPQYLYAPDGAPLLFLGDILPVRFPVSYMVSLGDLFISLGVFLFAWYLVRRPRAARRGSGNTSRKTARTM